MNERTTLEIIAPTVEEALAQGLAQLGLPAGAVSVEVLDSGSKGLFGLGGRQVRVRLTVNPPPGSEPAPQPASKPDVKPAPVKEKKPKPAQTPPPPAVEATPAPAPVVEEHDPLIETTEAIVSKLLHHLGFQAQVSAHYDEENTDDRRSLHVDVRGDDLSALIGRHAETLNALQYVASLMVGKEAQQWVQLVVDVEGYRGRREKQLRQLARRMAEQVIKTGRRAALEPMTSSERRVVHLELRGHPAVTTESTGEEPYRKVTILPKDS
ncbi:MAG: Jag N-terminal domain-containing protein [Chloroflexi bacterium]|nr:Jag N-terminal domain-containing protein [Chloroflexota bacterium]